MPTLRKLLCPPEAGGEGRAVQNPDQVAVLRWDSDKCGGSWTQGRCEDQAEPGDEPEGAESMLAYLLFANPNFLIPSTRPAGYFGLLLAGATSFYFFRFDRHRRQHFETTDTALTVIGPGARPRAIPWSALHRAEFYTNTGALVLHHSAGRGGVVLYPAALEHGAELVATIDAMTSLQLAAIPDLQAALARQR